MAIKASVYNQKGQKVQDINLKDTVFGVEVNQDLVHQASTTQMANERQVLSHTKERHEVKGGGRKPWRQKGTGRARAGSNRSPIWIGGGVTFGPTRFRNFKKKINKKMKQKAIAMVLSDRLSNKNLAFLDTLELEDHKTKLMDQTLQTVENKVFSQQTGQNENKNKRSLLMVIGESDEKIKRAGSNLQGVKIINSDNINILDLLKHKNIVFTQPAVEKVQERYK